MGLSPVMPKPLDPGDVEGLPFALMSLSIRADASPRLHTRGSTLPTASQAGCGGQRVDATARH